jgi:preprotein translocase subunit YajC
MGNMHYLAASSSGGGSYTFLIVIVVLFGLLYFVMIRPQRNKQRQAQAMQNTVRPGQRVRTTAGMYATVVDADDQDVVLEVAPGVHMRFLRRAVMETLPDEDGTSGLDLDGTDTAGTDAADSSFDEPGSPQGTAAEGTTDAPASEHLNGSSPGSTPPGSTAADHTAQDERTAD